MTTPAPNGEAKGSAPLLTVRGVKTFYGNIMALRGVDLDVRRAMMLP